MSKIVYHGCMKHPHYNRWQGMNKRCYNPNNKRFPSYGGRGISVYPEWRTKANPKAFCEWIDANLGPCPEGMSLDRIDNDGNYEPGNLRWASAKTQYENRRVREVSKQEEEILRLFREQIIFTEVAGQASTKEDS